MTMERAAGRAKGRREIDASDLSSLVGTEVGVSDWIRIDQAMIDRFADATLDHQFIHVDPERAARTPYKGTIAHGLLIVSLFPHLFADAFEYEVRGVRTRLNYGYDRIRFTSPIPVDSRVRARFTLAEATEKSPGQWRLTFAVTAEVEGAERPAVVADWVRMWIVGGG
jgi:acyl dehydratase